MTESMRPAQALVIAHPTVATMRSEPAAHVTAAGLAVIALTGGLLLPIPILAPIGLVLLLGLVALKSSGAAASRALVEHAAWRARNARRQARVDALIAAGSSRDTFFELDRLVTSIEQRDPSLADRLEIEALLDRYVALAVAHERGLRALMMTDRVQLERIRDGHRADPDHDPRRLQLCERRLECVGACEARVQSFADELAIVIDAIRLVAQRVACPDDLLPDDTVDRCLVELDARDAATRTLTAELVDPA